MMQYNTNLKLCTSYRPSMHLESENAQENDGLNQLHGSVNDLRSGN